jgi:excisionase family DNA binding protein
MNDALPDEGLLTLSEAADLTDVSVEVLRAEIRDGRLGAFRVRSKWMTTRERLAAWLGRCDRPASES